MHAPAWMRTCAVGAAILAMLGIGQDLLFLRPNRRALTAVMSDLRPGLTRKEVEAILVRHDARRLERDSGPSSIHLTAATEIADLWQLDMTLDGDRLSRARMTNGSGEPIRGGPADVGETR